LEKKGIEGIMRKNKKKTNSILIQSLRAEPRPGQPLFSVIVLSSAILDFLRIILNSFLCLLVICILSIVTVGIISWTKLKPEWGKFFRMLEYKSAWYGNDIIRVPTMYPSSQTCSCCGYKNPLVKNLAVRSWECPECHTKHDRDVNAGINILKKGLQMQSA